MSTNKTINKEVVPKKIIAPDGTVLNLRQQKKSKPSKMKTEIRENGAESISEITTISENYRVFCFIYILNRQKIYL